MSVLRHIEAPCAWSLERAPPRALARRRHRRSFLAAPRALPVRRVAGADRMRAVLDIVRGRKAEQLSDGLEELVDGLRVIRIARPHTQHVLVPRAARQNRATHAMAERELLADERERKLLPVAGGRSLRHTESHLRVRGPPRCGKVACVCVCVCVSGWGWGNGGFGQRATSTDISARVDRCLGVREQLARPRVDAPCLPVRLPRPPTWGARHAGRGTRHRSRPCPSQRPPRRAAYTFPRRSQGGGMRVRGEA